MIFKIIDDVEKVCIHHMIKCISFQWNIKNVQFVKKIEMHG